jgi:hypothetical protein
MRHPHQFRDRLDYANLIIHQHDRDQRGFVVDRRLGHVEIDQAIGTDLKPDDFDALPFQPLGAVQHRGMLGRDRHQFAALGSFKRALERPVERLGRARRKGKAPAG